MPVHHSRLVAFTAAGGKLFELPTFEATERARGDYPLDFTVSELLMEVHLIIFRLEQIFGGRVGWWKHGDYRKYRGELRWPESDAKFETYEMIACKIWLPGVRTHIAEFAFRNSGCIKAEVLLPHEAPAPEIHRPERIRVLRPDAEPVELRIGEWGQGTVMNGNQLKKGMADPIFGWVAKPRPIR